MACYLAVYRRTAPDQHRISTGSAPDQHHTSTTPVLSRDIQGKMNPIPADIAPPAQLWATIGSLVCQASCHRPTTTETQSTTPQPSPHRTSTHPVPHQYHAGTSPVPGRYHTCTRPVPHQPEPGPHQDRVNTAPARATTPVPHRYRTGTTPN